MNRIAIACLGWILLAGTAASAQEVPAGETEAHSPWGIAPSHSASWGVANWAPVIAEAGVHWIRGFRQDIPDRVLPVMKKNGFQVAGILQYSKKGVPFTFPVDVIPEWEAYVKDMIGKAGGQVRHWEVWNEPPNFSRNKSPRDYAKIVVAAYRAAKEADPEVQVGLAAQSVNLNFLAQALDAGAAGHFDYVTVHPYEVMDLAARGWEAQFMSIVPTIRKLLADKSPSKKDVPIWVTEVGKPVPKGEDPGAQADFLVKAYAMGIAQGFRRIHWFEGIDGDSGPFGLIAGNNGKAPKRPSYHALRRMIELLGQTPKPLGWLRPKGKHHAFVFQGAETPVMVAWAVPRSTEAIEFGTRVRVVEPKSGETSEAESCRITPSPVFITGIPPAMVAEARTNLGRPYLWDADYSAASSIAFDPDGEQGGLHPTGEQTLITVDGEKALDISRSAGVAFTVDPSFLSYTKTPVTITVVLRRNTPGAAGFNFAYESASGWKGGFGWYTVPGNDKWYTKTWKIDDPQFVGKWGYHFSLWSDSTRHSNYSIRRVTVSRD